MTPDEASLYIKSSRSGGSGGNCVECAHTPGGVYLRDSKHIAGPELTISHAGWASFIAAIRSGDFDRH